MSSMARKGERCSVASFSPDQIRLIDEFLFNALFLHLNTHFLFSRYWSTIRSRVSWFTMMAREKKWANHERENRAFFLPCSFQEQRRKIEGRSL